MSKFIDLTGKKFGKWKVLRRKSGSSWRCRCKCGALKDVSGGSLRSGTSTGCRKCSKGFETGRNYRLYRDSFKVGTTIGLLSVLEGPKRIDGYVVVRTRCRCGRERDIRACQFIELLARPDQVACKFCLQRTPVLVGSRIVSFCKDGRPLQTLFCRTKIGAEKRGLEFAITLEDLEAQWRKQGGRCSYTGIELTAGAAADTTLYTASIDRVDSSIGYVVGNFEFVHKVVNFAKGCMSRVDFLGLCARIATVDSCKPIEDARLNVLSPFWSTKEVDEPSLLSSVG